MDTVAERPVSWYMAEFASQVVGAEPGSADHTSALSKYLVSVMIDAQAADVLHAADALNTTFNQGIQAAVAAMPHTPGSIESNRTTQQWEYCRRLLFSRLTPPGTYTAASWDGPHLLRWLLETDAFPASRKDPAFSA